MTKGRSTPGRKRRTPTMHPLGESLLQHNKLIENLEGLIERYSERLVSFYLDEVETLERIHQSLQATLNLHQLRIQELRDFVKKTKGVP